HPCKMERLVSTVSSRTNLKTFYVPIAVSFNNPTVDPCNKYTILKNLWRSTTFTTSGKCDMKKYWAGWYRLFYQGKSTKMPESCVRPNSCGTDIPLWLSGSHPDLQDGVVVRQICGSYGSDCCFYKSLPIQVKACPGNYYVYEVVKPKFCNAAYCTEVDHCKKLTCTVDEKCGKRDQIYGCLCNENRNRSNPDIYVDKTSTFSCSFFCQQANGTHVIYENFIQVDSTAGPILREKQLNLSFACVYSYTKNVSIHITPVMRVVSLFHSIIHKQLPPGQGMYRVKMIPYEDSGFSQPLQGKVNVKVNQPLYVSVEVEGVNGRQIALLLDSCWATPVDDPDYYLLRKIFQICLHRCPNPKDGTVQLVENGISTTSRFTFRMFDFNKGTSKVFLHCNIHFCLLRGNNCAPVSFKNSFAEKVSKMLRSKNMEDALHCQNSVSLDSTGELGAWTSMTVPPSL
uniref:ZP domain-containing protein n=1 Tax=Pygocentrus nattereri TaxID=42514 RepID=A0A3B4EJE8_PYGNA